MTPEESLNVLKSQLFVIYSQLSIARSKKEEARLNEIYNAVTIACSSLEVRIELDKLHLTVDDVKKLKEDHDMKEMRFK